MRHMPNLVVPVPKISLGKKSDRSQVYEVGTLDGRALTMEVPVDGACAVIDKYGKAYLIAPRNQYKNENGDYVQFVGENCAVPDMTIDPTEIPDPKKVMDQISKDTKMFQKKQQFVDANKADALTKVLWIVGIPSCALLLMYGLKVINGG